MLSSPSSNPLPSGQIVKPKIVKGSKLGSESGTVYQLVARQDTDDSREVRTPKVRSRLGISVFAKRRLSKYQMMNLQTIEDKRRKPVDHKIDLGAI